MGSFPLLFHFPFAFSIDTRSKVYKLSHYSGQRPCFGYELDSVLSVSMCWLILQACCSYWPLTFCSVSPSEVLWHVPVLKSRCLRPLTSPALPTLTWGPPPPWPVPINNLLLSFLKQISFSLKIKRATEDDDQASGHKAKGKTGWKVLLLHAS